MENFNLENIKNILIKITVKTKSKLHKKYKNKILARKNNGLYTEIKVIKNIFRTVYICNII